MTESKKNEGDKGSISRRDFLVSGGAAIAAGALGVNASESSATAESSYEPSTGYIVYDSRLCFGCQSCMFACSMAHEGVANPSLSRIQIIRDAPGFTKYPYDIIMSVCRQCVTPLCVQNCPTGACHVDIANGNVRRIDAEKCIGCGTCIESCPQKPHRTVWNPEKQISMKCDLCVDAPYWGRKGGPDGHQACVDICPAKALKLVKETPSQTDVTGYDVDLAPPPRKKVMPSFFEENPTTKQEWGGGEHYVRRIYRKNTES
jgi:protein NrfC